MRASASSSNRALWASNRAVWAGVTFVALAVLVALPSYPQPDTGAPVVPLPKRATGSRPSAPAGATGALIAKGPAPALAVFATGDVIGYLEPCG